MLYEYLIDNSSKDLKMAVMRLRMYRSKYEFDLRNTTIDLLNIGTSYRAVSEYEYLHDEYYLKIREESHGKLESFIQ